MKQRFLHLKTHSRMLSQKERKRDRGSNHRKRSQHPVTRSEPCSLDGYMQRLHENATTVGIPGLRIQPKYKGTQEE